MRFVKNKKNNGDVSNGYRHCGNSGIKEVVNNQHVSLISAETTRVDKRFALYLLC
jgi:hypothetical protein